MNDTFGRLWPEAFAPYFTHIIIIIIIIIIVDEAILSLLRPLLFEIIPKIVLKNLRETIPI
jgi:hypothetical protein